MNNDVATYISEEDPRLKDIEEPLRQEIIMGLTSAQNMFRWIQCQLDEIIQCRSEDAIREQLPDLPQDLFQTYKRILQKITRKEDKNLAKHTLLWLVTAKRPMRLDEIVGTLAPHKKSTSLPSKPALLRNTEFLETCGSLVAYDPASKIVTLSHFSVKEFLVSEKLGEELDFSDFHISMIEAEKQLAMFTLRYLLMGDFRCKTKLWNEIRPLYYAVYLGNQQAVEVLLDRGADINLGCRYIENNSRFRTPLIHTAAFWGRKESLVILIEAGADIEVKDGDGSTALHKALAGASLDAIDVLCQAGCNLGAIGDSGKTAIQCVLELRNGPIIEYLFDNIRDPALVGKLQIECCTELSLSTVLV
ncbi:ankyrin repeat-containing domain protein [Trichophaea hybrida]|nr:ankyrin repeat-containing domain protein [Trichophaea hybrida]